MYLDATVLQAIELLHDAVTFNGFAHCLSCVVRSSTSTEASCGWQQSSPVLDRDLEAYVQGK